MKQITIDQKAIDNTHESLSKVVPKYLTDKNKTTIPKNIFKKREMPNAIEILRGVDMKFTQYLYKLKYFNVFTLFHEMIFRINIGYGITIKPTIYSKQNYIYLTTFQNSKYGWIIAVMRIKTIDAQNPPKTI